MKIKDIISFFFISIFLYSCANTPVDKINTTNQRKLFHTSGFALIYKDELYKNLVIDKKLNHSEHLAFHSVLKKDTILNINNPDNSQNVIIKIDDNANFPEIYSLVISEKVAEYLNLDPNDPFIEISEIRNNKTFIAKKSIMFDEEKNVAIKVPIDKVVVLDISNEINTELKKKEKKKYNFNILISDFYYLNTAQGLKNRLEVDHGIKKLSIKKIAPNKYRLSSGPFLSFNSLKSVYSSLNSLGFEELAIFRNLL